MVDLVYIFQHSKNSDEEIRFSMRSVEAYAPWVRKVWIFGDRPEWLSSDHSVVEHVPHDRTAWIGRYRMPVKNGFLLHWLASLIPDLTQEYLYCADDYVLLSELSMERARTFRYIQDLATVKTRGTGTFKESLWRTFDLLKRKGYGGLNFESHSPVMLTKRRVMEAFREFEDFVTEDRFQGPLAMTSILNHAMKQEKFQPVLLSEERPLAGFHDKPAKYEEIVSKCEGKLFLNFDDSAYSEGMRRFLTERFPNPSRFEQEYSGPKYMPRNCSAGSLSISAYTPENSTPSPAVNSHVNDGPLGISKALDQIDSEPSRCVVLVPHQGRIVARCQSALLELERRGYVVRRVEGYSAIDAARNQMATDALKDGFDETMWIDSDVGFEPDDVDRIRQNGIPICCAIYPMKGRRSIAAHIIPGTKQIPFGAHGGLMELMYAGTGFLHVRRNVYEQIRDKLQLVECNTHDRSLFPFFQPLVRSWRSGAWSLGEDYSFCHRARQAGIPIVADTRVRLWHFGEYGYSWEDAGIERDRYANFNFILADDGTS